ncbi:MAG: hypothetical protein B6241_08870 [Spirochaetaceae bacterium 4572_59]|nr:MAG: hypothetical protein B6241_08870 [Spirochaetaceae bacterium 4572_59]
MKNSLIILGFFACGTILGLSGYIPDLPHGEDFSMYVLYLLMFLVGLGIGGDSHAWSVLKNANFKILLVPLAIVVGSLGGAALIAGFLGGMSLSSLYITSMRGEMMGTVALLSNIMREIFTLLMTPFLVRYSGPLAAIASGGATSMDTTLPIISLYSGKEFAVISLFSGIVLTVLVPFLVPFILSF